jgi:hypothetical protein
MTCGYEAPTWAHYPDGRCIDGWLWDLDSGDGDYLTAGGDIPCPACNTAEHLEYQWATATGNARQRRVQRRAMVRKRRAWAIARSTFACGPSKHTHGVATTSGGSTNG